MCTGFKLGMFGNWFGTVFTSAAMCGTAAMFSMNNTIAGSTPAYVTHT